ncbi:hypothetical protein GY45DRAFT_1331374 [Cubamyces sp. BRFM 1775]|nr:hypothetical protein GY45DRAFT_1331374 [Cubamyces sp. BRFM 1775]
MVWQYLVPDGTRCPSSSECSVDATPDSENYMAPIHPLVDTTLGDPSDHWQRISLAELLGGALFENADPWKALDEVLHLGPPDSHQGNASDLLALVETCDTFSAGHDPPPCCLSQASRDLEVVDPERPTPDSTLEMATSGDAMGGRSVERGAQVTDTDRVPIDCARDSCNSGVVAALVEVGSNPERPPRCEQSDGPPAKASSPGSDPHASPPQPEAPVELRGDDDGPARMVMSRQGISPLHDNAEAYDALPLASGRAMRDDREVPVIGDHALVDGPSLFSDFEDFESEEE